MSDGYCDVCGLAPPGGSARVAAAAGAPAVPSAGSAGSDPHGSAESRTNTVRRLGGTSESTGRLTGVTGSGSGRNSLGAGLVDMPTVPERDPRAAVLEEPEVP
ncbi:MAG TPA: serine/threonine protein kinase, partial [Acidimicrobiales bacterium]